LWTKKGEKLSDIFIIFSLRKGDVIKNISRGKVGGGEDFTILFGEPDFEEQNISK
jgi:hypothetical protein